MKTLVLVSCLDLCSAYDAATVPVPNNRPTTCVCFDGVERFAMSAVFNLSEFDTGCEVYDYSTSNTFSE